MTERKETRRALYNAHNWDNDENNRSRCSLELSQFILPVFRNVLRESDIDLFTLLR